MSKRPRPQTPAQQTREPPAEQKTISPRRRRIFVVASILLPFAAIIGVEGILRLSGRGGFPPAIKEIGDLNGSRVVTTYIPGAASYFDQRKSIPGSINQYAFSSPKPAGTIRIVLVGGSAIKGFPQSPAFAPSAFLAEMLGDAWPDRTVEVINLGTTAVASFPALEMMTEMLAYEPDLVVLYTGHNEFFGAYGVASLQSAGNSPAAIRFHRWFQSLALVQLVGGWSPADDNTGGGRALMEVMVGKSHVGPADPLRAAAARNLQIHVDTMIDRCQERGIAVIACTLPSNERHLAPIGTVKCPHLAANERKQVDVLLKEGMELRQSDPAEAVKRLEEALRLCPDHALAHYRLGNVHFAAGEYDQAARHFQRAVDLDPMPWRAPSRSNDAIRTAAEERGAILCDIQRAFRDASPGGCVGKEFLDDHVHPTLEGQSLIAREIVRSLTLFSGELAVSRSAFDSLPSFDEYAARMGSNVYEQYAVAHSLRSVFDVPFIRQSNPQAYERCDALCKRLMNRMPPAVRATAQEWQKPSLHKLVRRPLSGMVARAMIREQRYEEAERLMDVARKCVPLYSTWCFEYTYFLLVCRQKLRGGLGEGDSRLADETIQRIKFMTAHGAGNPGLARRFCGRLHQLRGEYAESIPYLTAARDHLWGMEKVANDAALIDAYVRTDELRLARELARQGLAESGEYAGLYRQLLSKIPGR